MNRSRPRISITVQKASFSPFDFFLLKNLNIKIKRDDKRTNLTANINIAVDNVESGNWKNLVWVTSRMQAAEITKLT